MSGCFPAGSKSVWVFSLGSKSVIPGSKYVFFPKYRIPGSEFVFPGFKSVFLAGSKSVVPGSKYVFGTKSLIPVSKFAFPGSTSGGFPGSKSGCFRGPGVTGVFSGSRVLLHAIVEAIM